MRTTGMLLLTTTTLMVPAVGLWLPPDAPTEDCTSRGPTPLVEAPSPAQRAAVPLATSGQAFISIASASSVWILDLATGERTVLAAGIDDPHEVAVSPDGRWGVAADFGNHLGDYGFDGRRLAIFDLREKQLAGVVDLGAYRGPHDLIFISPDRLVVTAQTTRHVVEVDVVARRVIGAVETRAKGSHTMAVTADGRTGFTANEPEGTVTRVDLAGRRFIAKHRVAEGTIEGIAATPDGRELWVGAEDQRAVLVIDAERGAVTHTLPGFVMPHRLAMSPDGRYALITDFRCEVVQVADVATRTLLGPIAGLEGAGVAKVLPDSRTALVLMLDERVLAMVDIESRRVVARHPLGRRRPDAAAWGPAQR